MSRVVRTNIYRRASTVQCSVMTWFSATSTLIPKPAEHDVSFCDFGLKRVQTIQVILKRVEMRFGEFLYEREKRFNVRSDKRIVNCTPSVSIVYHTCLTMGCSSFLARCCFVLSEKNRSAHKEATHFSIRIGLKPTHLPVRAHRR